MIPVEQAVSVYRREQCTHTFTEALDYYLLHGYVINTPNVFVMARVVHNDMDRQHIINPWYSDVELTEKTRVGNVWHIHLMAGDMREAFNFFPYPLPFMSFEKRNKLKFYKYERFWRTLL